MQMPLQLTFRGMDSSPALETRIRQLSDKLEHFHDRITKCEVVVEQPAHHHRHGSPWHVRITINIPGHEIVVSHDPGDDDAHADVYVCVRDAFLAARRQLDEAVAKDREKAARADVG
ncbi:MAG: ribosome-associated translation inhibitor RaiA [Kofleriaceae bacterium]|nr:ribosome-associated translation inhibitor RaiA [Myxococcales bacterium]MCB9563453.1 ribosome-associated translation inhibitor RaiA [Kofleriaceae bacterium]MCB9573024.1 ribosome-associated translation inhibitor RaiA [Kofleriaceae bacterium]